MKKLTAAAFAAVAAMVLALGGCGKAKSADRGYDVYFFNNKGENGAQVAAMAKAYEAETGVRVKTFSIGAGAEQLGPLTTEMNSKNMPTIFCMEGFSHLNMWLDGGYVVDLATVTHPAFQKLVSEIPESMRLTLGDGHSYGIPFNIEGYGYIVDKQILADIFGASNVEPLLASLKTATYDEWEAFVKAMDAWIKAPKAASVTLSSTQYQLPGAKSGLAANLTGVFVLQGAVKWSFASHFLNVALNPVFSTMGEAFRASDDAIRQIRSPFIAYAKALDLKSTYAAGKDGPAKRGQDMVSPANYGYDQSVQIFADSKALFIKQGNWCYTNIANVNPVMAERLTFVPVKMPFSPSDITVPGLTVEKMARSIPVFPPNYYAVNALCTEEEKNKAYDFLVWMNTSKTGQHYVVDEMAFIPYNADPAVTTVPNSLGNSIIDYVNAGDTLAGAWMGTPQPWAQDTFGQGVMEQYLTKEQWTQADYEAIADSAVDMWIKLKQ